MPTHKSQAEVEFFAKEEVEKRHRLHELHKRDSEAQANLERRKQHHMKCGKCGGNLKTIRMGFVDVEECQDCGALLLDKGELEKIKASDNPLFKALTEIFKR